MTHAFKPTGGAWIEISQAGTRLTGAGESGEDVVVSEAFVSSLSSEVRTARGFVEVVETEQPEDAIGWTIEDVDGAPTRAWIVEE